ncbi:type II secretion system F family protein [Rubellimicrobium roseum]|uniref:Type II secretion system F family protein n=1 Tax=Rubellimicrobium roseum TaxID=687525 RepID=A0A5C4N931_9RHOB|nr:type II secretion system F family protein [Rubellimicrobium roseum]TNC59409.1 type II secretion system F family protein [Rubellimicrobium roseum]
MTSFALEQQEIVYAVYVGIALGAFLLITGLAQLLSRSETGIEARNRRMRMIRKGATTEEVLALLKPSNEASLINRLPFLGHLSKDMRRAGMTMEPGRLLLLSLMSGALVGVFALGVLPPLQAGLLALGLGYLLPVVIVRVKRQKRMDALVAQLPDALELMARGLKVGHPLNTSISHVAHEMPDPIGSEFGIIFDQVAYGDDLVTAVQDFAERVDVEDVHYLAASIAIQHGTGGDLARIVDTLARVIRGRIVMRRKIKAISSEGRLSAWFLSAIPFLIYGMTSITNPSYYGEVADDPVFLPMMITIGVLVAANALILRKLVNFRV